MLRQFQFVHSHCCIFHCMNGTLFRILLMGIQGASSSVSIRNTDTKAGIVGLQGMLTVNFNIYYQTEFQLKKSNLHSDKQLAGFGCSICSPTLVFIVQSPSHVQLSVTSWTEACQAPLSSAISQSLLKFISIEQVILSNCLILCLPQHWYCQT